MDKQVNYVNQYDVFLSYRRDGGETMAILLRDRLTAKGYRVFLDVESLNSGSFNKQLLNVIENCTDVVVVLSKGSLDRCVNENDWVRTEISHALNNHKNIVPVMLRGFDWPKHLPDDIDPLRMQNGVNATQNEYFDAAVDRLAEKFLFSKTHDKTEEIEIHQKTAEHAVPVQQTSQEKKSASGGAFLRFAFLKKSKKLLILSAVGIAAVMIVAGVVIISPKNVENKIYFSGIYTGSYTGVWQLGKPKGEGVFTVTDNLGTGVMKYIYNGEFKDGKLTGQGSWTASLTNEDMMYSSGEFKDNWLNGQGVIIEYEHAKEGGMWVRRQTDGEFKNHLLNGQGKRRVYRKSYTPDGITNLVSAEEGNFEKGVLNGDGKVSYRNDNDNLVTVEGYFAGGVLKGKGSYKTYNEYNEIIKIGMCEYINGNYVAID